MKKIIATLAVLALSNTGIALAQTTDVVVATPATTVSTSSANQIGVETREAEDKIRILQREMEDKIKAVRLEYKAKIGVIRQDVKAKREAIRKEAQIKREAEKIKRREEAAKARLEAKNKKTSEIHNTVSTTTTGTVTQ